MLSFLTSHNGHDRVVLMNKGDLVRCPVVDPLDRFRVVKVKAHDVVIMNVEGQKFVVSPSVCVVMR